MSQACMGGWCSLRDRCRRHTQEDREHVAERLCELGDDDAFEPGGARPAGTWERHGASALLRRATWICALEPT